MAEKLPGPIFTIIVKALSIFRLFFVVIANKLLTKMSLLLILVCNFCIKKLLSILKPIESFLPVQFIIKKLFIISLFISFLIVPNNSYSSTTSIEDYGVISLMYHRFNENKYPSTNIKMIDFKKHIEMIEKDKIIFIDANNFIENVKFKKNNRKVLLTIDDAFLSFYKNAWPFLKKKKIPFILFVSTKEIGSFNYMNWEQLKEVAKEEFVHIGNHSHTHDYLIDLTKQQIKNDITKSISLLEKNLGYETSFFSYPFGEYSSEFKQIIKDFNFKYAFGQHSGVIDETKDFLELPRFPVNEKYGELNRFKILLKTLPLKFKKIKPSEKYIDDSTNPPQVFIEFFENTENLKDINCYSNEMDKWTNSKINFISDYEIEIILKGKFITERGRINCSLRDETGFWRWLGIQFVIKEK
jgi:peptidoglycan/xylan/chitin deacetylase (PgdA/CDA1 family)